MEFKGKYSFLSTTYGSSFNGMGAKSLFTLRKDEIIRLSDPTLRSFLEDILPETSSFSNVESAFQLFRVKSPEDFVAIYNTENAFEVKKKIKGMKTRKGWTTHRDGVMRFLTMRKFVQNKDLAEKLCLVTETLKLENTYSEYYWGTYEGRGQNVLGNILRETRKAILGKKIENFKARLVDTDTKNKRDELVDNFCRTYNIPISEFVKSEPLNTKSGKAITFKNNEYRPLVAFMDELKKKGYFILADTETTGIQTRYADIIELSAIKIDENFNIVDEFDTFINPGYALPPEIVEFNQKNGTGICDELLATAPKPKAAYAAFKEFIGEEPLICGHNIPFDIRFIDKLSRKAAKEPFIPEYVIDTLKMAKEKIPGSHKLGDLYKQIPNAPELTFHKSIDDVKATLEVLKWLIPEYLNEYRLDNTNNLVKVERNEPSLDDFMR